MSRIYLQQDTFRDLHQTCAKQFLFLFGFILQPDSAVHVHWKGAAEIVLACCTSYINVDESLVPMEEDKV